MGSCEAPQESARSKAILAARIRCIVGPCARLVRSGAHMTHLPHRSRSRALSKGAGRIRKSIEAARVEFEGKMLQVTVSIGISTIQVASSPRASVMAVRSADDALYEAKERGRNNSVFRS